ncbi:MAG: Smr/MutS family protein [Treponema sp.]|nr:Smr/MutS family protein [Treponema sp.]
MNFETILKKWDSAPHEEIHSKDDSEEENRDIERRRLLTKKPDAFLDLHGLTQDEAWDKLDEFFKRSRARGLEKVLVIHGKGNHSMNEGVLGDLSRKYIEQCPFAGTSGHNSGARGGSGATWVLLKS